MLRMSKDPNDPAFDESATRRRVWCRDTEIPDWVLADEFRRVVITSTGKVLNGGVLIERLEEDSKVIEEDPGPAEVPIMAGFAGAGLVFDKPAVQEEPKATDPPIESCVLEPAPPDFSARDSYDHN